MIQLAIVEDDEKSMKVIEQYILRYQQEKKIHIDVDSYQNGLDFISNYTFKYQLVFLDIEMPRINGLDLAHQLRKMDDQVCIIFVTNMAQYAINGYEVQALDFMVKPVSYFNFALKLEKAVRQIEKRQSNFIFINSEGEKLKLDTHNIFYIESNKHYLYIHTQEDVYKIRSTMNDFMMQLPREQFALCNKSYCINFNYITHFRSNYIVVNDETISITRTYKKDFLDQLTTYINRGGN